MDWSHLLVTAAGFVATIATIKTDIRWIKRWTHEHEKRDESRFARLEDRFDNL